MNMSLSLKKNDWESIELDYKKENEYGIHNYHDYPGKFIPSIPRKIIEIFLTNSENNKPIVMDNFCGCGTTLVEARLHGINGIGIDNNQLAFKIAKVKTTPLNPKFLKEYSESLLSNLEKENSTLIPEFPNQTKWFNKKTLKELGVIFYNINNIEEFSHKKNFDYEDFKNFLLICFSSILIKTANPTGFNFIVDNMLPKEDRHISAIEIFKQRLNKMIIDMEIFYNSIPNKNKNLIRLFFRDARYLNTIKSLKDNSIDLAVTSPPYLNGLDYAKMHRLSYYWLGIPLDITNEIGARSKRSKKDCIRNYFDDMQKCFTNMHRLLKEGSFYVVVVNDTYYKKEYIPTHKLLMKIGKQIGFKEVIGKRMVIPGHFYKNHQKKAEWILFFKK